MPWCRHSARAVALAALLAGLAHAHAPSIALSRRTLSFFAAPGGVSPSPQSVVLSNSTHGRMPWSATVSTSSGGSWLSVNPTGGVLPGFDPSFEWAILTVFVNSTRLAAGSYSGAITIAAPGDSTTAPADNSPQVIQVSLTIGSSGGVAAVISLSPGSLAFDAAAGRTATLPLQVSNAGGGSFNWTSAIETTSGGNWLSASPRSGSTTAAMTVTVNTAGLNAGTYNGRIVVSVPGASNSPQSVSVTLRVTPPAAPALQVSSQIMNFFADSGGPSPATQALLIYNSGEGNFTWRADFTTFNGGPWLAVTPSSGSSPANLTISTDSTGLAGGTYAGRITVFADGAINSPAQVSVMLTVRRPQPVVSDRAVVNAATFLSGFLAPGQIVTVFGSRLGPRTPVAFTLDPVTQKLPTNLAGTQVTFDGIPAPLFFVSDGQVNLQVPFEVAGRISTRMRLSAEGLDPAELALPVRDAAPGVFTVDGVRAAALNQDYSLNSPANPAAPGSVIQLYLTGQGIFDPPLETGALAPASAPFPAATLPVTVTMDGMDATVLFAGAAPGFAGLTQLNVEVPRNLQSSNDVGVWVLVGSNPAGKRVTIAVR